MLTVSFLALAVATAPAGPQSKTADKPPVSFGLEASSEYHWPLYVLSSPGVQKELKLTKEQIAKLEPLQAELKKRVEATVLVPVNKIPAEQKKVGEGADQAVAAELTPEQRPRDRQIVWQVMEFNGGVVGMATNPVFAKEVGLNGEQQKKAKQYYDEYYKAWLKLVQMNPGGNAPIPGADKIYDQANEKA